MGSKKNLGKATWELYCLGKWFKAPSPTGKKLPVHLCEYFLKETCFYQKFCKNVYTTRQLTNTAIVFQLVPTKVLFGIKQMPFGEKVHNDFVYISYYLTEEPVKHPYQVLITQFKQAQ